MNKIEENGAVKEKISVCHKKWKMGQRKRKKVAVIKKAKWDSEQKVKEMAKNKVKRSPKIWAKKRQKGEES